MSSKALLIAGLATVVGGVLLLLVRGGVSGERGPGRAAPGGTEPADATPTTRPALDAPVGPAPVSGADAVAGGQRTAAATGDELETAGGDIDGFPTEDAQWIEVFVPFPSQVAPDDVPALLVFSRSDGEEIDEWSAHVIARSVDLTLGFAQELDDDETVWARRELPGSGTVRVPLAAGAPAGLLVLQSRTIYAPVKIVRPDAGSVTLATELGAHVTGRCVLAASARERGVARDDIDLAFQGRAGQGAAFGDFEDPRDVRLDDALGFELRAVSASGQYMYRVAGEGFVDRMELSVSFLPGEHRVLEIELAGGATLAGRVRGDDGSAIAGADVMAGTQGLYLIDGNSEETTTDAQGEFVLPGLAAGTVELNVAAEGWLEGEALELEVVDGQRVAGLEIVLRRGNTIAGTVLWPDGRAAEGARVSALATEEQGWRSESDDTETNARGEFELSGLLAGPFEVRARLDPEEGQGAAAADESARLDDDGYDFEFGWNTTSTSTLKAHAENIAPNTTGLVLTLVEPVEVAGTVRDDTGAPITAFDLTAHPSNATLWEGRDTVNQSFEAEDGSFRLGGLFAGQWLIEAQASGYSSSAEAIAITVPYAGPPLALVLDRGVSLAGIVVDPGGLPITDASVTATTGGGGMDGDWDSEDAETDEGGRFSFERVALGGLHLVADHEEWAASEQLPIELAPGDVVNDLVLRLRHGGTITGEVFDDEGNPHAGQEVSGGSDNFGFGSGELSTVSDEAGRFRFDRVTPGRVVITAMPSEESIIEAVQASGGDESAMINFIGQMRMETVEVRDEETVHVLLGHKAKAPVRVHGLVSEAGQALPEVQVFSIEEGGAILQGMKAARADDQGRYQLIVDRPGDYVFNVGMEGLFGEGSIPFYVSVPEVEEFEQDLALPLGRISGRVSGPDGASLAGYSVRLSRAGGLMGIADIDQSNRHVTDADGQYSFEHLAPGSYAVRAGGDSMLATSASLALGATVTDGIEVGPDESVEGVDFELVPAGKLKGVVRDGAGNPVPDAAVFVRDEAGRALAYITPCSTDATGRFTYPGLAPGRVTVSARTSELTCADSLPIEIRAGETSETELALERGAYLLVSLLEEGQPVRARVRVLDGEGRQVNGMMSQEHMEDFVTQGFDSRERRVGPVPPGRYTLIATSLDGKDAKKTVTVRAGQGERRVRLRLR